MKKFIFLTILFIFLFKQFSFATYDDLRIDRFTSARKDVIVEGGDGQYDIKKSSINTDEIQGLYLKAFQGDKKDFHFKKGDTFKYNFSLPSFMCESLEIKIKNLDDILFTKKHTISQDEGNLQGEGEYTFNKDEIQIQFWLKFTNPKLPTRFEFTGYIYR